MIYRDKPYFIIKKHSQKIRNQFMDILTQDVLKDVCKRATGRDDFTYDYVENDYRDEFVSNTYNKGRLAILLYKDCVTYISFSENKIHGRNSSIQSVPTAFNIFFNNTNPHKRLCYYFLPFEGNAETDYHIFIYRLMRTIGFKFLNSDEVLTQSVVPFNTAEDIVSTRRIVAGRNSANNSTYITKGSNNVTQIYGKIYGANKYETSLLCYALSYMNLPKPIQLYEINDNGLSVLPQSCLDVIRKLGKVIDIPTGLSMEQKLFNKNNSLRSPRYIYNLLAKLGHKKCALCECEIPELIAGAHVWPVSDIKQEPSLGIEKKIEYATDGENGIWLCQNHHKMFDEDLLEIDTTGRIVYKTDLEQKHIEFMENITTIKNLPSYIMTKKFVSYLERRYESV